MRQAARVQRLAEREPEVAPATDTRLSVSLVGRLAIRFNGQLIELRTQKAAAVLSYLALIEAKHESRERLVGLLWSRSDEEKARGSLRQVIRELRATFEAAGYQGSVRVGFRSSSIPRWSRSMSKASSRPRRAAASSVAAQYSKC